MGQVLGDMLPIALGVAISPMPIMAVVLMLMAPDGRGASLAFLLGWIIGIGVVLSVVVAIVGPAVGSAASGPSVIVSVLKIILGAVALLLAVRQWQARPKAGDSPARPRWMAAIDQVTPIRALGLGALLSAVNPKNLTLCLAGGLTIGSAALGLGQNAIAIAAFVVIGSCTVAVPVIGHLVAQQRVQPMLDGLRDWLAEHNSAVMATLLLVIGVTVVGKGIAGL